MDLGSQTQTESGDINQKVWRRHSNWLKTVWQLKSKGITPEERGELGHPKPQDLKGARG